MELKLLRVAEPPAHSKVTGPHSVIKMMREEAKADRECFWVLHLNTAQAIIEKELVAMGILNQSLVHPREVFRKAVMLGVNTIITVHNHPSGTITPSDDDIGVWNRLKKAGEILGIKVVDNVIITPEGRYYSENEEKYYSEKRGEIK